MRTEDGGRDQSGAALGLPEVGGAPRGPLEGARPC